ncbi:MAG TPA: LysM peptidoglycan-binding domain-containing protein [Verrucomicrobiales bacterium]|nr:LysM peptidoglycan-binding domain-containing protein [Verrucomicrobiales bacterium]
MKIRVVSVIYCLPIGMLALILSGCSYITENENATTLAYFEKGERHQRMAEYTKAIEAFERALRSNPEFSRAHLQLGTIYHEKMREYGSAIHHYKKYIKYKADDRFVPYVNSSIDYCKEEIARQVSFDGTYSLSALDQLAKLTENNDELRHSNDMLQAKLSDLDKQLSSYRRELQVRNSSPGKTPLANASSDPKNKTRGFSPSPDSRSFSPEKRTGPTIKRAIIPSVKPKLPRKSPSSYQIRPGDNFFRLEQRYGWSTGTLQRLNPGLKAKNLKVGRAIKIPAN